ncbi:LysR family transcriptional regulator [Arthrobacter sp. SDTb3-6]
MELQQLHYAIEVQRRGSFTSAADALHVDQSAVSASRKAGAGTRRTAD